MCSADSKPLFPTLGAAADDQDTATEIDSLCMNCHEQGITRLLLTRIPHYREVVLMSFSCDHCGFTNNEIQPGGPVADKAVRYTLRVETPADLNRQIVKSDHSSVRIEELDLEIPALSQKGEITTVEGVVARVASGLAQDQEARREADPATAARLDAVIDRLRALTDLATNGPFTLVLEDISGNSWIENPNVPSADPRCRCERFTRSTEQDHQLGVFSREEVAEATGERAAGLLAAPGGAAGEGGAEGGYDQLVRDEVLCFPGDCPACGAPAETNMKLTSIPHFKDVVIMATTCDHCGHRTNEVKSGGGVEPQGIRIEVRVEGREDFSRDVLKSETCSLSIPELELEVGGAALGGRFTTAEGLLQATRDQLRDSTLGDSADEQYRKRMDTFLARLERVLAGEGAATLVLDDPAGNSYVQSLSDAGPDARLRITRYQRSFQQDDELGLNDMKTEGYEQPQA